MILGTDVSSEIAHVRTFQIPNVSSNDLTEVQNSVMEAAVVY
jgi:hypothetical protein